LHADDEGAMRCLHLDQKEHDMSVRYAWVTVLLAASALTATAQGNSYPGSEAGYIQPPPPIGLAPTNAKCSMAPARHDHGMERQAMKAPSAFCNTDQQRKTPAKPLHDHAKFHKNQ
jgi:hypothetical protein